MAFSCQVERRREGARALQVGLQTAGHRFVSCVSVIWTDSFHESQWLVESPQCESQRFHLKIRFQCFKSRPEELFLYLLRAERLKCLIYSLNVSLSMPEKESSVNRRFPHGFQATVSFITVLREVLDRRPRGSLEAPAKPFKKLCDQLSAAQLLQSPHRSHHCNPNVATST